MGFKNIGLALTYSPNGVALLKIARRLMELYNSQLQLVHVGEKTPDNVQKLDSLFNAAGIGSDFSLYWRDGEPAKMILNFCRDEKIDLLISGALEKENVIKYYVGSVARTIMRKAPCSVLVAVNPVSHHGPYKRFCVPVDYSRANELALRKAYNFAMLEKAEQFVLVRELQVPGLAVAVSEGGSIDEAEKTRLAWENEEYEKLKMYIDELGLKDLNVTAKCLYGKSGWEARNFAEQNGSDLFVVSTPPGKLKLFDRFFQHDLEFVLSNLPCSLLIIRD